MQESVLLDLPSDLYLLAELGDLPQPKNILF